MDMKHLFCFLVVIFAANSSPMPKSFVREQYLSNPSVQRYREYLQIDTRNGDNLGQAVDFWRKQAHEVGLEMNVYWPAGKPVCVISWPGQDPTLPSIMLNSHMDVVPVEEEFWSYPPFDAHMDLDGDIYARGAQDDKDVAIQYLEAIRRLKETNVCLQRTLHITLMPDEETGGFQGMALFKEMPEFRALNVGFVLDEGSTSTDATLYVTYVDRRPWQIKFTAIGASGHSSGIPGDTAMEKLQKIIAKIDEYRHLQKEVMNSKDRTDYGAYDSVNINMLQGGVAPNVIPVKMSLLVDVRLAVDRTVEEMQQLVDSWMSEGGNGTRVSYIRRVEQTAASPLEGNIYWDAMREAVGEINYTILPLVCPAASDMILIRDLGIPAFGFSPKTHTTSRLHGNDEYLNVATFLQGIEIYVKILQRLGNLPVVRH